MAEMDWVECTVKLGGDNRQIIHKSKFDPVSIPELSVLRRIHGDDSVGDVVYVKTTDTTFGEEKNRLLGKYSSADVDAEYPGRNPNMHLKADDRPSKDIVGGVRKTQRPGTKQTAAAPFIPEEEDAEL